MDEERTDGKGAKIVVGNDGEEALERMLAKVNDGFRGGRVGKQELATWIVCQFEREGFLAAMGRIRTDHFDELVYLDSVVRELRSARKGGDAAVDMASLLAPLVTEAKSQRTAKVTKTKRETTTSTTVPITDGRAP